MKKRMKKVMALTLSAAMVASLSACGESTTEKSSTDETTVESAEASENEAGSETSDTTSANSDALEVVIWDNNQKAGLQEICDEFTAETGIPVDIQVKDWDSYWTVLEAGAAGGDLPDVFWMHSNNSQMYMKNDMLLQLDDYIEASDVINLDNYMSEVTELYTWEGKHYAIPKDYDTIAIWYNKTMFDAAGLSYPDDTWTWDDFYEAAVALTDKENGQYGYAINPSNNQDSYYNMVYSMGGYIVNEDHSASGYDDENTIKAMEYVGKLLDNACPDATTMSETGPDVLMESGTVAMITQGSWMTAAFLENEYMTENCDCAILPYDSTTGKRVSICNGLGWAASATTDRPDDCWKLIEWFGSEEMQKKQADLGVTMSAYNNTSDTWVNCTDVFDLSGYLAVAQDGTNGVTNELVLRPYTYNTTVWETAATSAFTAAWADTSLMKQTSIDFAAEMNNYIAAENK